MGHQHASRYGNAGSTGAASGTRAGTPGKRTRTQSLPPKTPAPHPEPPEIDMTAEAYAEDVAQEPGLEPWACDPGQHGNDCFLSTVDRNRLARTIDNHVHTATTNWALAFMDERLERATAHESGWNALWEIGLVLITNRLGVAAWDALVSLNAMSVVMPMDLHIRIAKLMNSVTKANVISTVALASKGLRNPLRKEVDARANQENTATSAFLDTLKEMPGQWATNLLDTYPKELDDPGWLLLSEAVNPAHLTVAHFQTEIRKLVDRWDHEVNTLGKTTSLPGYEDTAIAAFIESPYLTRRVARVQRTRITPQDDLPRTGSLMYSWVEWISDDMVDAALATGAAPSLSLDRLTNGTDPVVLAGLMVDTDASIPGPGMEVGSTRGISHAHEDPNR